MDGCLECLDAIPQLSQAIWDFDGTLVDSEPVQAEAYRLILAEEGIVPPNGFFVHFVGQTEIWCKLAREYSLTADLTSLRERRLKTLGKLLEDTPPNWFTIPLLDYFNGRGARSIIVSSGTKSVITEYLSHWGLADRFDSISATDPSRNGPSKTERLTTAIRASVVGATVVLDDMSTYLAIAREAGAVTIGVLHSLNGLNVMDVSDVHLLGDTHKHRRRRSGTSLWKAGI